MSEQAQPSKPQQAKQPADPPKTFNPADYVKQAAEKQQKVQAEQQVKEQAAQAEDTAKYSGMVGKTFTPKGPGDTVFLKIRAFQVRVNLGPGPARAGYLIERHNPHSSWWVGCELFLNNHQETELPEVVARSF